jgi:hypothetical protein
MVSKKKWFVYITLLFSLIGLVTFIWICNYKIIDGDYSKLTITKMGTTTDVIKNKDEIQSIINKINISPRKFHPNTLFHYDYLPHGLLIFQNDKEKVEIAFVIPKGNILTKYWEIETSFEFGKMLDEGIYDK